MESEERESEEVRAAAIAEKQRLAQLERDWEMKRRQQIRAEHAAAAFRNGEPDPAGASGPNGGKELKRQITSGSVNGEEPEENAYAAGDSGLHADAPAGHAGGVPRGAQQDRPPRHSRRDPWEDPSLHSSLNSSPSSTPQRRGAHPEVHRGPGGRERGGKPSATGCDSERWYTGQLPAPQCCCSTHWRYPRRVWPSRGG